MIEVTGKLPAGVSPHPDQSRLERRSKSPFRCFIKSVIAQVPGRCTLTQSYSNRSCNTHRVATPNP